jgi:hypothetical protein
MYIEFDDVHEAQPNEESLVGHPVQLLLEPCWVDPTNRQVRQLLLDCGEPGCNYGWIAYQHPYKAPGVASQTLPCEKCNPDQLRPYAWFILQSGIQGGDS